MLSVKLNAENAVAVALYVFQYSAADDSSQKSADTADAVFYCKSLGDIFLVNVAVCDVEGILIKSRHRHSVKNRINDNEIPGSSCGEGKEKIRHSGDAKRHRHTRSKGMLVGEFSEWLGNRNSRKISDNIDELNEKYTHRQLLDLEGAEKSAVEMSCNIVNNKEYKH